MEYFVHDALTIEAREASSSAVELVWRGRSRDRQPGTALIPYLTKAIGWAADRNSALEMRFDRLEFFNSATIMVLIQCIHLARSKAVRLRLLYALEIGWQRLSFDPMRVLGNADLLEIGPVRDSAASTEGVA